MLIEFEQQVAAFMERTALLTGGERILLAVSGGADSVAMLHALESLRRRGQLDCALTCAHINHQLRADESERDEETVARCVRSLGLDLQVRRIDVGRYAGEHHLSVETAGREVRRKALFEIARDCRCTHVAMGHHKNDNAETLVQRLARGTGLRGLGGIWPRRVFDGGPTVLRPLLCVTRGDVHAYLARRSLHWREDSSNRDCRHRRNFIRHQLMPALEESSPGVLVELLFELSESARRLHNRVANEASEQVRRAQTLAPVGFSLEAERFAACGPLVQVETARRILTCLGCREQDLSRRHFAAIVNTAKPHAGDTEFSVANGCRIIRRGTSLRFLSHPTGARSAARMIAETTLVVPGRTRIGQFEIEATLHERSADSSARQFDRANPHVEVFDWDRLRPPIRAGSRRKGERFHPLGMPSEKKIGKFLTTAKVPVDARAKILVFRDAHRAFWLCPVRICEPAKVTSTTKRMLRLAVTEVPQHDGPR